MIIPLADIVSGIFFFTFVSELKYISMKIHQYTSIDSLALILKNKTIRFKRLDKMDDIEEAALSNAGIHLGGFMFVSCWTYNENESIPLWRMYTPTTKGVRISLDKDMFKKHIVTKEELEKYHIQTNEQNISSIIPLTKMFTTQYTILNTFWNENFFYQKIEYTDDLNQIYNSLIQNNSSSVSLNFENVGRFKHKHWKFQDECRFRLIILPNDNINFGDKKYATYILSCVKEERFPIIDSFFIDLKDNVFDNLTITLSPYATEADKLIVNALCKEYAPNAHIIDSSLKGKVRL